MTSIKNRISAEHRFAKRGEQEYNVFSSTLDDVSLVEKWVAVSKPHFVLMDAATFEELKDKKIRWIFDEENGISECKLIEEK